MTLKTPENKTKSKRYEVSINLCEDTTAVYYRVSTVGQSIESQQRAVEDWIAERAPESAVRIYQDLGISGSKNDRPGFRQLMTDCTSGKITRVVVYKLDRLTRDALTGIQTIIDLDAMGIEFVSVSQPMFHPETPFRRVIIAVFAELAQMERDQIRERVIAGLEAARRRGVKLGAPKKVTDDKIVEIVALRDEGKTIRDIAESVGVSTGSVSSVLRGF